MAALGVGATPQMVDMLFDAFDEGKTGQIELPELKEALAQKAFARKRAKQQYEIILARGNQQYEREYRREASARDYTAAVDTFKEAIEVNPSHSAAHFALAVAYKAKQAPTHAARAACDAIERCAGYSETWADAVELAYTCLGNLTPAQVPPSCQPQQCQRRSQPPPPLPPPPRR